MAITSSRVGYIVQYLQTVGKVCIHVITATDQHLKGIGTAIIGTMEGNYFARTKHNVARQLNLTESLDAVQNKEQQYNRSGKGKFHRRLRFW
jgi:hypothetical protein